MNKKSVVKLLSQLRQLNIQVIAEGEKLRYQAPKGVLTPELRQEIAEYKAEILAFLSTVNRNEKSATSAIEIIPRNQNLPLSFGQERLWFLDQLQGSTAYNEHGGIRITGKLDVTAIQSAFAEVLRRHEVLRTTFPLVNGKPTQAIAPQVNAEVALLDWQHLTESTRESQLQHYAQQQAQTLFDLASGPLVCATLVHLAAEEWVLLIVMHHIICDYWSVNIFIQELSVLYQSFTQGQPSPLPELVIQYADYASWQRHRLNGLLETQLSYWKKHLADAPSVLQLPSDRPRPSVQSYRGEAQTFILDQSLTKKLQQLSQTFGTTLFMTLLTAFSTLLYRYSNQEDIVIGSPIANRNRAEIESLIGFIANVLVLRVRFENNPSFAQLLEQVREVTLQGYAHQDVPFEQVVEALQPEHSLSYSPLYQVMFVFQNVPKQPLVLPGVTLKPFTTETQTAKFDLSLMIEENEEGLIGIWKYNTDLFNKETIARMTEHFQILLSAIVTDPQQPVSQLPLLSEQERSQLVVEWNQTAADYRQDKCIHQLFEEQVQRTPDVVAVVYEDQILTYRELNNRANQVAHYLQDLGVQPETLVGICVERSFAMVVGLLGILKAGGAYVPLDPTYPKERLAFMLSDSQVSVLLTQKNLVAGLPEHRVHMLCLDTNWGIISHKSEENPVSGVTAENLAYVIYTSGLMGKPKGVTIQHRSVLNLLRGLDKAIYGERQDSPLRVSLNGSLAFDTSVKQIIQLLHGHTLVIIPEALRFDGSALLSYLQRSKVDVFDCTPSQLRILIWAGLLDSNAAPTSVLVGGEPIDESTWQALAQAENTNFYNVYGPTECTVDATVCSVRMAHLKPVLGRPIANTQIYILDSHKQPVPIGVPGELHIGGAPLARGYLNRPELTAEKFIPNPFNQEQGVRLYKTGDLARYLPDAKIQFLGRIDNQVKIRGFRIELGEIETVLIAHPLVQEAIVIDREDTPNKKSLVAYIVAQQNSPRSSELFSFLKQKLPDYMVPKYFVILDALPLTPNGKVDRKALPAPQADLVREGEFVPPQTPIEQTLAAIWQEVLEVSQVGIHDNFFAIGGDSILSIQVVSQAKQVGIQITPKQLFQYQTLAELAAVANTTTAVLAQQKVVTGEVPLTPIQKWFFEQNWFNPHHFNQSVLLQLPNNFNPSFLSKAVSQLLEHHDALRLLFISTEGNWRQINKGLEDSVPFEQVDLSQVPQSEQLTALEEIAARLQASLNLNVGPLMRVVLFNLGSNCCQSLLIAIHHLAVDGVSWRILLEDLFAVYQQLERGESVQLQKKTTAFQDWAIRLSHYAQSNILQQQLNYWLNLPWSKVAPLPVDEPANKQYNTVANAAEVSVALDKKQTDALLQEVCVAYNTQINDVLLTALAQSLRKWTGKSAFLIDLEGHGREDLFEEVDLSRTVGWFTSLFPVLLHLESTTDLGETLKAVKEQLRGIPLRGIGYGILRYLNQDSEICIQLQALPQADIRFNYFGQFAQEGFVGVSWQFDAMSKHFDRSSEGGRPYLLDVNAMVVEGKLQITWTYCCQVHHSATVKLLAHNYIEELQKLIDHCLSPEAKGYTPSDFPEAGLSQEQLDTLLAEVGF
ncbi:non-ribosomal peptide synthase [Tolypothrix sp. NIES-4075]|uniref:non-ribosomal peptide synthetase n=1 Tax=Tolypothrix sp. NIES-4075 TaxID=2005459 RepID=UPI000B5C61A6|nr:non-ribosomal peptide synthetase [Tolypothrix sp. NIES-4075]GAX45364.1 non-ribosomal peptide synthase [Tolypothrix sp. NIES-4075]